MAVTQGDQGYPIYVVKPYDETAIKNIAAPYSQLAARMAAEKESYTLKQQASRNMEANLYMTKAKTLDGISTTGNKSYDKNMRIYMDEKVDEYVQIKNGMDSGRIDSRTGARALQAINNQIDIYKRNAPNVLGIAKYAQEVGAGGNNTSSKLNDPNLEILLQKLLQGSSDISLGEDDGVLMVRGNGQIEDPNNIGTFIPWKYDLNIDEFEKMFAQEDEIIRTVPTRESLGFESIAKPLMAAMSAQGNYKQIKEKNGQTSTAEYFNIDQIKASLLGPNSNTLDSIIQGGDADTIWADMFLKGHNIENIKTQDLMWDAASDREYTIEHPGGETYTGNMMSIMKQYLADQVISMIPPSQQIEFEKDENGDPLPTGAIRPNDKNFTWNENMKEESANGDADPKAIETLELYLNDPTGSMESTLPRGSTVTESANGIITINTAADGEGTGAGEDIYDLKKERDFIDYYMKIRERKGMFKGDAIASQNARQDFEKALKTAYTDSMKERNIRSSENSVSDTFTMEDFEAANATSEMTMDEKMTAYRAEISRKAEQIRELTEYKVK